MLAIAVCVSALLYHTAAWPPQWRPPRGIPLRTTSIAALIAGGLAAIWLTAAIVNGRRWRLSRAVRRLSRRNPGNVLPDTWVPRPMRRATPVLQWDDRRPWKVPRPPPLHRVTATRNVVGRHPLFIVYLRIFENQPRARTFLQGAWREFGYVHLLRSAESVTPAEFHQAKRSDRSFDGLLIDSQREFADELRRPLPGPSRRRWQMFRNIGPRIVWTRDWYGSYPPRTFLCHGRIWKQAVDMLLARADLVVLDLSGMTTGNEGTRYEVQRVIDRIPIERVIFLADRHSRRDYLHREIQQAWHQMAYGSPNDGVEPRVARLAVTDSFRQIQEPQGDMVRTYYRLVARRWQSRRLAADHDPDGAGRRPRPPIDPVPSRPSRAAVITAWTARLAVVAGCGLFWASVAWLTHYANSRGWESLLQAATNDRYSPLHPHDFKILIVLDAVCLLSAVISMLASRPSLTAGAVIAALGLTGYTLYIPREGSVPGFGSYGSSYWCSLVVAIAMTLAGVVTLIAGPATMAGPATRA
jgi:hypothetical protein